MKTFFKNLLTKSESLYKIKKNKIKKYKQNTKERGK